jgi:flagellin
MTVINTNIAATITANAMKGNQRSMETTMERLATGLRVNSAKDDAAGLAIGTKMDSLVRGYSQAVRNANDGIAMLQTVDGAAEQITNLLQRMRELAVQGQNDTNSTTDLANLNEEFVALGTEIERIADTTQFNGENLMNSSQNKIVTIGAKEADIITLSFGDFQLGSGAASTAGVDKVTMTSTNVTDLGADSNAAAASTITLVDTDGNSLTITQEHAANNTGASGFGDITLAELATEISTVIDNATAFAQLDVTESADGSGLTFTQETGGSGGLASVTFQDEGVLTSKTVTNTVFGDSGSAASPMADNLSSYASSGGHVQATGTIENLDNAITGVNTARAVYGSNISRLSHTIDNLEVAIANTSSARSSIMDADYAAETTELARTQIISQAATAMLSQANQAQQSVLALLK